MHLHLSDGLASSPLCRRPSSRLNPLSGLICTCALSRPICTCARTWPCLWQLIVPAQSELGWKEEFLLVTSMCLMALTGDYIAGLLQRRSFAASHACRVASHESSPSPSSDTPSSDTPSSDTPLPGSDHSTDSTDGDSITASTTCACGGVAQRALSEASPPPLSISPALVRAPLKRCMLRSHEGLLRPACPGSRT